MGAPCRSAEGAHAAALVFTPCGNRSRRERRPASRRRGHNDDTLRFPDGPPAARRGCRMRRHAAPTTATPGTAARPPSAQGDTAMPRRRDAGLRQPPGNAREFPRPGKQARASLLFSPSGPFLFSSFVLGGVCAPRRQVRSLPVTINNWNRPKRARGPKERGARVRGAGRPGSLHRCGGRGAALSTSALAPLAPRGLSVPP